MSYERYVTAVALPPMIADIEHVVEKIREVAYVEIVNVKGIPSYLRATFTIAEDEIADLYDLAVAVRDLQTELVGMGVYPNDYLVIERPTRTEQS